MIQDLILSQKGSIPTLPESLNTTDSGTQYIVEEIGYTYDFVPVITMFGDFGQRRLMKNRLLLCN